MSEQLTPLTIFVRTLLVLVLFVNIVGLLYLGAAYSLSCPIKKLLTDLFPESAVHVRGILPCGFSSVMVDKIGLYGSQGGGVLQGSMKRARIKFSMPEWFKFAIKDVVVDEVSVTSQGIENLAEHIKVPRVSSRRGSIDFLSPETITIHKIDMSFIIGSCEYTMKGNSFYAEKTSHGMALQKATIDTFTLLADCLEIEGGPVILAPSSGLGSAISGEIFVDEVRYGKFVFSDIYSGLHCRDHRLEFSPMTSKSLGASWQVSKGWAGLVNGKVKYELEMNWRFVDFEQFLRDMTFDERVIITGSGNGLLTIKGEGYSLNMLSGGFEGDGNGGAVAIKSPGLLATLMRQMRARYPDEDPSWIKEMEEYPYESMWVHVFRDRQDGDIGISFLLNGSHGRQEFDLYYHVAMKGKE